MLSNDPKSREYIGNPLTMEDYSELYGLVDPREQFWDDQSFAGAGRYAFPYSQVDDRAGGRNRPWINTEEDLKFARGVGRFLHEIDSTSIGVMNCLINYIISTGFNYTVVGERRKRKTNAPQAWIDATQNVIDEVFDKNDFIGCLEAELFLRSRRDGEFFTAIYEDDGIAELRIIEPEQVTEPQNKRDLEDRYTDNAYPSSWLFGIHTPEYDVQKAVGYHVTWNSANSDTEYFRANEIKHMKCNVDRAIKRGISDYFPVYRKLSRLNELATNTVEGAAVQAAIAFIREHVPNTRSDQVQALIEGNATIQKTVPSKNGTTKTRFVERLPSRSVKDIPAGMKYLPGPQGQANAPNYIAVIQSALRDVGIRWNMPEYMISGDASNANYSSTMVAESPFVKACVREQKSYGKTFSSIIWRAVEIACEAGIIPVPFRDLKRAIDINVEYPDVAVRNLLEETQRRETENRAGVLSLRTWAKESGRDFDAEQENIAKEPKRQMPTPFGQDDGEGGPFQRKGAVQGAIQGAIEEAEDPITLRNLIMEAANWDESKHPRADNGRFISAGAINAAKGDKGKADELRKKVTDPKERKKTREGS